MIENSIPIVPYGETMVALLLQGWGMVELAAILWENPRQWVGLAASKPDRSIGLAATVMELTGYIWIWQI